LTDVEIDASLSEVKRLCDELLICDDENDRGAHAEEMEARIRSTILRVAAAIKKDYQKRFGVLEQKIKEMEMDIVKLKTQRSTPDAIHTLLNFIRLARYNVKLELVKRGVLQSADITWENVKKNIVNQQLTISFQNRAQRWRLFCLRKPTPVPKFFFF
jgi:hypothetical protein